VLDSPSRFSRGQAVKLTLVLLGFQLASGFALGLFVGFVIGFCRGAHIPVPTWADSSNPVFLVLTNMVTYFAACHYALKTIGASWRELLIVRGASASTFLALLVTLCGTAIVMSEISNLTDRFLPRPAFIRQFFGGLHDLGTHPFAAPIALVVMAPITEEFFFRGLLLRRLLATRRAWAAIWTSALLFMAFHVNPWQFMAALALGLLLGWVYARTRSLGLCLFAHTFHNAHVLLATGLPFHVRGFNLEPFDTGAFQPLWFDALGVTLLLVGLYGLARTTSPILPPPRPAEPPILADVSVATDIPPVAD
jgi:membrane protease YdiL (CAAX protease family)